MNHVIKQNFHIKMISATHFALHSAPKALPSFDSKVLSIPELSSRPTNIHVILSYPGKQNGKQFCSLPEDGTH